MKKFLLPALLLFLVPMHAWAQTHYQQDQGIPGWFDTPIEIALPIQVAPELKELSLACSGNLILVGVAASDTIYGYDLSSRSWSRLTAPAIPDRGSPGCTAGNAAPNAIVDPSAPTPVPGFGKAITVVRDGNNDLLVAGVPGYDEIRSFTIDPADFQRSAILNQCLSSYQAGDEVASMPDGSVLITSSVSGTAPDAGTHVYRYYPSSGLLGEDFGLIQTSMMADVRLAGLGLDSTSILFAGMPEPVFRSVVPAQLRVWLPQHTPWLKEGSMVTVTNAGVQETLSDRLGEFVLPLGGNPTTKLYVFVTGRQGDAFADVWRGYATDTGLAAGVGPEKVCSFYNELVGGGGSTLLLGHSAAMLPVDNGEAAAIGVVSRPALSSNGRVLVSSHAGDMTPAPDITSPCPVSFVIDGGSPLFGRRVHSCPSAQLGRRRLIVASDSSLFVYNPVAATPTPTPTAIPIPERKVSTFRPPPPIVEVTTPEPGQSPEVHVDLPRAKIIVPPKKPRPILLYELEVYRIRSVKRSGVSIEASARQLRSRQIYRRRNIVLQDLRPGNYAIRFRVIVAEHGRYGDRSRFSRFEGFTIDRS